MTRRSFTIRKERKISCREGPRLATCNCIQIGPLTKRDRNGYQLKFYCPIICKRVRKNCGTRDKREARSIQRECRERLLNGEYAKSYGVIAAKFILESTTQPATAPALETVSDGISWDDALERYRSFKSKRTQKDSFVHAESRIGIAERVFTGYPRGQRTSALIFCPRCYDTQHARILARETAGR